MPRSKKSGPETTPDDASPRKTRVKTAKNDPIPAKKGAKTAKTETKTPKKRRTRKKPAEKTPQHAPDAKELELIRKKNKILDLREGGASIRQISQHLIDQGEEGCSPTRVHELLAEALEDMYRRQRLKTRQYAQLELNKLDRLELAHFGNLLKMKPNDKGTDTYADSVEKLSRAMERIWKRRDALLGLHKPTKVQIDARETLAKLLGKSPEELPSGDLDA